VSFSDHSMEPEQELRWRTWQEQSRLSDQLAERRMKIVFWAVAALLITLTLYWSLRRKTAPNGAQPIFAVMGANACPFDKTSD